MRDNVKISVEEINKQIKYIELINDKIRNNGLKYNIQTMGCQLNENDSEKISGMLENMGYEMIDDMKLADIVIFNTCCIRENAENKLFGKIGELKKIKKDRDIIIAIGGCMSQQEHIIKKIKESYSFIDIIFGTHTLYKLPELIYEVIDNSKKIVDVIDIDGQIAEGLPIKRNSDYSASVTIMYGCNNFCSYCIVPYVRGRERSRRMEDIINEIKDLANNGYKEVTLLGQNVNSYGNDLEGEDVTFANLLYKINDIEGIEIIKFMSPHPKDFTDDVIEAISKCKKVYRLIHLPLQSGSTRILGLMNRKYTKEQYINLAKKIKEKIPDISFTTDVIVGFPSETDEDFRDTIDVLEQIEFEQVFMFIYSRRKGTVADQMENQIDENIKGERLEKVKDVVTQIIDKKNKEYIGKIENILIEGISKTNGNMLTGRTKTNKVINLEGSKELIGTMQKVKIVSDHLWYLKGKII